MITTPTVVDNCVDQYKTPTPTPAVTPAVKEDTKESWDKWNNRWGERTPEMIAEGTKRALLWPQLPKEWSDILHAYYNREQNLSQYAPSPHDSDKIKDTIDTLERVKRTQNNTVAREDIDKIIHQLNMDLMYFKLKHGK